MGLCDYEVFLRWSRFRSNSKFDLIYITHGRMLKKDKSELLKENLKDFLREYVEEFGRDDTEEIIERISQLAKYKIHKIISDHNNLIEFMNNL